MIYINFKRITYKQIKKNFKYPYRSKKSRIARKWLKRELYKPVPESKNKIKYNTDIIKSELIKYGIGKNNPFGLLDHPSKNKDESVISYLELNYCGYKIENGKLIKTK